ncbi:hypothetical protein SELMODRAFT_99856 [Selaginella moellendorffii]|uniref:Glycolipid transfer protein domain-containing protein n=2 Tax=Selaginella moellendorffii TaxID=88036 RepID=D8RRI2_SELML|nr:hypothetical protein SELMODRAFT_175120 [Selaginella moellendorffii]EFJ25404.1 hypothetical protein SELMODRAFT_99856 [Selaginella moellendorffii]
MALAFGELAADLEAAGELSVTDFAKACSLVSVLFGSLGFAFKFAEKDYTSKVDDLVQASERFKTLGSLLEVDVEQGTVRNGGSHSRNLLRVKRGIEMVKILFEHILESECSHLRDSASKAYEAVFSQHHPWAIRKAVAAGTYTLPSKSQFLKVLKEDDASARIHMSGYVGGVKPVIHHVETLFLSRNLGLDW